MAVHTLRPRGVPRDDDRPRGVPLDEDERPSGVPEKGRLGASRNELIYLIIGLLAFVLIALGFWYEAAP